MPFFKTPSYMAKAKTMENKPYGWVPPEQPSDNKPAESSSKSTSNESSETLVAPTTTTTTTPGSSSSNNGDASTSQCADRKEPLSAVERIKLEREYEKAHPKEPIMPAKGIWKSKWMVVPAAVLYGFGGG